MCPVAVFLASPSQLSAGQTAYRRSSGLIIYLVFNYSVSVRSMFVHACISNTCGTSFCHYANCTAVALDLTLTLDHYRFPECSDGSGGDGCISAF